MKNIIRTFIVLFLVLGVSSCIKNLIMPGESMEPTLHAGDMFMMTYVADDAKLDSLKRGDVVVFKADFYGQKADYIQRIIGLPNDRIQMENGLVRLNGKLLPQIKIGCLENDSHREQTIYKETLPDGRFYYVLDLQPNGMFDNTKEFIVPEGHYFMLGDNRDNSDDSRINLEFIARDAIKGKATKILWRTSGGWEERATSLTPKNEKADQ